MIELVELIPKRNDTARLDAVQCRLLSPIVACVDHRVRLER
jgi:hypothetical protein